MTYGTSKGRPSQAGIDSLPVIKIRASSRDSTSSRAASRPSGGGAGRCSSGRPRGWTNCTAPWALIRTRNSPSWSRRWCRRQRSTRFESFVSPPSAQWTMVCVAVLRGAPWEAATLVAERESPPNRRRNRAGLAADAEELAGTVTHADLAGVAGDAAACSAETGTCWRRRARRRWQMAVGVPAPVRLALPPKRQRPLPSGNRSLARGSPVFRGNVHLRRFRGNTRHPADSRPALPGLQLFVVHMNDDLVAVAARPWIETALECALGNESESVGAHLADRRGAPLSLLPVATEHAGYAARAPPD